MRTLHLFSLNGLSIDWNILLISMCVRVGVCVYVSYPLKLCTSLHCVFCLAWFISTVFFSIPDFCVTHHASKKGGNLILLLHLRHITSSSSGQPAFPI